MDESSHVSDSSIHTSNKFGALMDFDDDKESSTPSTTSMGTTQTTVHNHGDNNAFVTGGHVASSSASAAAASHHPAASSAAAHTSNPNKRQLSITGFLGTQPSSSAAASSQPDQRPHKGPKPAQAAVASINSTAVAAAAAPATAAAAAPPAGNNAGAFSPDAAAERNAAQRLPASRVKLFPRPDTVAASNMPSASEFSIVLTPPAADATGPIKTLYQRFANALLKPGCNTAHGRANCFSALLHALGGEARQRYASTRPTTVEYLRLITPRNAAPRLARFIPPLRICNALVKSLVDERSGIPYELHVSVRYPTPSIDGAATFAALQAAIAEKAELQSIISMRAADAGGYARLRFRLDEMASVAELQAKIEPVLPAALCPILNADEGCLSRGGSHRFSPIVAVPLHMLASAKASLRSYMVDHFVQPQPFCSGCGTRGSNTTSCSECTDADKANPVCFQCQRRKREHTAADYGADSRCTYRNYHPCMLCGAQHEPFRCLHFNAHWEPCFPSDRRRQQQGAGRQRQQQQPQPQPQQQQQQQQPQRQQQQQQRQQHQQQQQPRAQDGGLVSLSQQRSYASAVSRNQAPPQQQRAPPTQHSIAQAAAHAPQTPSAFSVETALREQNAALQRALDDMRQQLANLTQMFMQAMQQRPVQPLAPLPTAHTAQTVPVHKAADDMMYDDSVEADGAIDLTDDDYDADAFHDAKTYNRRQRHSSKRYKQSHDLRQHQHQQYTNNQQVTAHGGHLQL